MKVNIIDENNEGLGVARINNKVTFIPFAIKDEIVDINIIKENKKYDIGNINRIIDKSSNRKEVLCPYYYECGGCDIMHMNYDYQLDFKKRKVINNLKHISNIEIEDIDIIYDDEYNYRNHIILSIDNKNIGFLKKNTNEVIDIDYCLISNKVINNKIKEIRTFINRYDVDIKKISIKAYDEILINIESNNFNLIDEFFKYVPCDSLFINNELVYGKEYIPISFNNYKFEVSSKSFFQKNTNMAIKLYDYIKENVDGNVLDLYCGVGSIGIYISNKVKSITGIEIINDAIKNAENNKKINNVNNIKFICGKVEDNLDNINNIDTIIVDPPRVGLNKKAIDNIITINPNKIIYVSCNSTTLARDINYMKNYKLKNIKLFDMFPNTNHIESVCILERK